MSALHIIYNMLSRNSIMRVDAVLLGEHDGYNTDKKHLIVSREVIAQSNTSRSMAVIAHECGHVEQNLYWYYNVKLTGLALAILFCTLGFFHWVFFIANLVTLFLLWLIRLVIEFNASYRGYKWLKQQGIANMKIVRKVYTDALLTYVFSFKP